MNIIPIIFPLIALALIGYLIAKKQWLSASQLDGLSKVTFAVFIPAFLFYRMATADLSSQLNPTLFASFYLPVLACFALGFILNYYLHNDYRRSRAASAIFALGASYSNNIIVGLPVLLLAIGDEALPIIFLIVTFHSAMLFGLTNAIATSDEFNWPGFVKQNLSNPLIVGILSGFIFNILSLPMPEMVASSLSLLGQPAIPLALIALGASIAKYDIRGERRFIAIASLIKLIVLPTLVYFTASQIFQLSQLVVQVLVILSACPAGVNAYIIAQTHQVHRKAVASTVVVSTLASAVTIPCWLLIMGIE